MKLVKLGIASFGLFIILGGFLAGRSESFKRECVAHKIVHYDMGSAKNILCDVNFTIRSDGK